MKRATVILTIMLISFVTFLNNISTASSTDVSILVESNKEQYSKQIDAKIAVIFNRKNLYNDSVFLSYHLYDKDKNEILWEGKRFPLEVDKNGYGKTQIKIDLASDLEEKPKNDVVYIKFDLVDEKNIYWFSTNQNLNFTSEEIIFNNMLFEKLIGTLRSSSSSHPILFSINLLVLILFIVGYFMFRKEDSFNNLVNSSQGD